jgi:hypothetical protein
MYLVSLRLITDDMKRSVGSYETITGLTARWYTEDFAELVTSSCTLAIGSTRTVALSAPASRTLTVRGTTPP